LLLHLLRNAITGQNSLKVRKLKKKLTMQRLVMPMPLLASWMKGTTFVGMFMSIYCTLEEMGNATKQFYKSNNTAEKRVFIVWNLL
jgi:hypothetical protein